MQYGYPEKVNSDAIQIMKILNRQGSILVLHCLAESVDKTRKKFSLSKSDIENITNSLLSELRESILERT